MTLLQHESHAFIASISDIDCDLYDGLQKLELSN
jgi:hypothetical protein